jgi:hypothetical protein
MDVGVDERRRQEAAGGVELVVVTPWDRAGRPDPADPIAVGQDVDTSRGRTGGLNGRRVRTRVPDEQTRGGLPLPTWSRVMLVRAGSAQLSESHAGRAQPIRYTTAIVTVTSVLPGWTGVGTAFPLSGAAAAP